MTDTLASPTVTSTVRARTVLKRNGSSRGSMIAASAVSFFKQNLVAQPTVVEDDSDDEDASGTLFYDTIYPMSYNRELVTFDVLDHYFLQGQLGSNTFTQFKNEPLDVLDIGCGAGTWIIDTAKSWILTHFTGFDVNLDLQPRTDFLSPPDLQHRIRWVQGDFLQRLPFPTESFDFVRCSKIGLAVPETRWQPLLSEISRVLRPGGSLEIIEENLIFPLPPVRRLRPSPEEAKAHALATNISQTESQLSDDMLDDTDTPRHPFMQNMSPSRPSSSSTPPNLVDSENNDQEDAMNQETLQQSESPLDRSERDPRNHGKLKRAWEAMLDARGINPRLLSVLNLYLSSCFERYSSFTTGKGLVVPLPGPSAATLPDLDLDDDVLSSPVQSTRSRSHGSGGIITENASLHLLHRLATIMACRKNMLPHFKQLEGLDRDDDEPEEARSPTSAGGARLSMSGPPPDLRKRRRLQREIDREEFGALCSNYERDMLDRVGMGETLASALGWKPPPPVPVPRDSKDEMARWREDIRTWRRHELPGHQQPDIDENVSRTLNIWTAIKAEIL
ncbi:hypothetical protein BKA62DRAFT_88741 [Auriculariales sp. MPI-PUGE-AT-0066]|nr:hypothetical protein BKA62DRAFT_88741 [Auriculariales sp. MPI-PUGE-AT-0066]